MSSAPSRWRLLRRKKAPSISAPADLQGVLAGIDESGAGAIQIAADPGADHAHLAFDLPLRSTALPRASSASASTRRPRCSLHGRRPRRRNRRRAARRTRLIPPRICAPRASTLRTSIPRAVRAKPPGQIDVAPSHSRLPPRRALGEADLALDRAPAQIEPAARLEPLGLEAGERRAVEKQPVDDGRPQDRRGSKWQSFRPMSRKMRHAFEIEHARDPGADHLTPFSCGRQPSSPRAEETQERRADDPRGVRASAASLAEAVEIAARGRRRPPPRLGAAAGVQRAGEGASFRNARRTSRPPGAVRAREGDP